MKYKKSHTPPPSIRLKAALRLSWVALVLALPAGVMAIYATLHVPQGAWAVWAVFSGSTMIGGLAAHRGWGLGPWRYKISDNIRVVCEGGVWMSDAIVMPVIAELAHRWGRHPDTKVVAPYKVWKGLTIAFVPQIRGGIAGMYHSDKHAIHLDAHAFDSTTLSWELGHALMHAEHELGTEGVTPPHGDPREYEHEWMLWRRQRGLL